ncbi:MAG: DUF814 domain-containing protein [Nitrospirales bacterium]|nr:DUF814 domain-containing protein [Nitrospirales bacterium]
MTITELSAVLGEIAPLLIGGWIQKIHQPSEHALTLEIRVPGKTLSLLLSANPRAARVHLLHRRLPNPPAPPPFCQFLRAHIQGATITHFEQVRNDRIVLIQLQTPQDQYILVVALTGRHANLLILNSNEIILSSVHPALSTAGQRYCPPTLPPLSKAILKEQPLKPPILHGQEETSFPISQAIEAHYTHLEDQHSDDQTQQAQTGAIRKDIKKLRRRIEAHVKDLEKMAQYQEYKRYGELLKGSVGTIHKGQSSITVTDYFDDQLPDLTLPLDPAKDFKHNMDDYFRKYRKYVGAERELRPRLEEARETLTTLEKRLNQMEQGGADPSCLYPPIIPRISKTRVPTSASLASPASPYRQFVSQDGFIILVGKHANQNEELTFKEARSHDWWFHARGTPGSHVVLKCDKGTIPPRESIHDAATLALWYSDLKKSGKGEVMYTPKKFVKRVKGQKKGAVIVTQDQSVWIHLEPARLSRLKTSKPTS